MIYIGIDPGVSGGLAFLRPMGTVQRVLKMPGTEAELLEALGGCDSDAYDRSPQAFAYLERVWSSPGWGHVGAFKFGLSYGGLRMALTAIGIPFEEVLPIKWQQALGCRTRKDKNISKRRAESLFPGVKVTHAIADALLIAEFCRRVRTQYGEAQRRTEESQQAGEPRPGDENDAEGRGAGEKGRAAIASAAGDVQGPKPAARQSVRGDRRRSAHDGERAER